MEILEMVKDRLKQLGYDAYGDDDTALLFLIEKVDREICTYCNLSMVPYDLIPMEVDKVCGEYLRQLFRLGKLTGDGFEFEKGIQSITEGDSSFTFASSDDSDEAKFVKLTDWLSTHDDDMMTAFRKLRW